MKQLTLSDVRSAMLQMLLRTPQNLSDEELLAADFWFDLGMDEQQILNLTIDLQRGHHIYFPPEVTESLRNDNTVRNFLTLANRLLVDMDEK